MKEKTAIADELKQAADVYTSKLGSTLSARNLIQSYHVHAFDGNGAALDDQSHVVCINMDAADDEELHLVDSDDLTVSLLDLSQLAQEVPANAWQTSCTWPIQGTNMRQGESSEPGSN